jgi:hypothetical protein
MHSLKPSRQHQQEQWQQFSISIQGVNPQCLNNVYVLLLKANGFNPGQHSTKQAVGKVGWVLNSLYPLALTPPAGIRPTCV